MLYPLISLSLRLANLSVIVYRALRVGISGMGVNRINFLFVKWCSVCYMYPGNITGSGLVHKRAVCLLQIIRYKI